MSLSLGLTAAMGMFRKTPNMSQAIADRLNTSVVPSTPRKIVFGTTSGGQDVRFFEGDVDLPNTKKDGYAQVIALASHRISAFKAFYAENDLIWSNGSWIAKRDGFANANPLRFVLEGASGNGLAVGSGRYWNSSATFTGCAYYSLFWRLDAEGPFPSGPPARLTAIIDGCPLYDPRRDSTRGGSGPHRLANQATWTFTEGGVQIGRNPALALLTYLIGYRINGRLVWGMGIPADRIAFDNFRNYANICEEQVATQAGSTVQRYTCDAIYSTADTHETVISSITAAMGSCKLSDRGGQYGLIGGYDDTAGPKIAFDENDLVAAGGGASPYVWNPAPPARDRFNIVRGRFADPANLYQLTDWGDPIEIEALPDNVPRVLTLDLGAVSRAETCQRIAKQFLLREAKTPGNFTALFGPKGFAVQVGSVITLSLPSEGWNNKLFRVIEQAETHDLLFQMTLREEDPAIYAWDREEKPLPAIVRPQGFDPSTTITPANLSLATRSYEGANRYNVSEVDVTWTPEISGRVAGIQIQSRPVGETGWTEQAALYNPKAGLFTFSSNAPGIQIEVQARYRMSNAIYSPWNRVSVYTAAVETIDGFARDAADDASKTSTWTGMVDDDGNLPWDRADRTLDVLENRSFALLSRSDRIGTETRKRFDPLFWTCNFPNTMIASVRKTAPDAVQLDAVFHERGHLAGLIWDSTDTLDHPTTGYDTNKDYRNCKLVCRMQLVGDVQNLTGDNGPILTIEGRAASGSAHTWYVRLGNCVTSGTSTDAVLTIDFNNLPGGFYGTDDVYTGDIDRMFISMVPSNFNEGSTARLFAPIEAGMILSNIVVTGANSNLVCGLGPGGVHEMRMANGYDDTYNVTPARIVRNCQLLGYKSEFNHYVGMSHYFNWAWDSTEGRYIAQDSALPLNTPCRLWHKDLAEQLKAAKMDLILSLSYELMNSFIPTEWRQLDSSGRPALTGWEPPSSLFSPCNNTGMNYLHKVARQFADIAAAAGLPVHFQVGEPWYWVDFRTYTPCFYDFATTAKYTTETSLTAPTITTMTAVMNSAQIAYLDWLGEQLARSILSLLSAVRVSHPTMRSYALLYLPQLLNRLTPETHRVNMPPELAYPALDVLQVEDYDFVIENRTDLSATGRARVEETLGYPRSAQHYFAGFALYKDTGSIWRYSTNAATAAHEWGVSAVFVWAYTQVMRDGYVPRIKTAPPLTMRDMKNVNLTVEAAGNDVLAYELEGEVWKPGKPWLEDISTLDTAKQHVLSVPLTQTPTLTAPWINYGGDFLGARYYKTVEGIVILEGLIQAPSGSSTTGVTLFTLLPGYRPSGTMVFTTWNGGGAGRIDVDAAGNVIMQTGNAAFTSLAGIAFVAT